MSERDRALLGIAAERLGRLGAAAGLTGRHEISLTVCDNPSMRRLNRRWRQVDASTDVLSFPLQDVRPGHPPSSPWLGDIVISLPYARRAAREIGCPFAPHLDLLLAHGLLHLLGYDHQTEPQHKRMRRREVELLSTLPPHA